MHGHNFRTEGKAVTIDSYLYDEPMASSQEEIDQELEYLKQEKTLLAPYYDQAMMVPEDERALTPITIIQPDEREPIVEMADTIIWQMRGLEGAIELVGSGEADSLDPNLLWAEGNAVHITYDQELSRYPGYSIKEQRSFYIRQLKNGQLEFEPQVMPVITDTRTGKVNDLSSPFVMSIASEFSREHSSEGLTFNDLKELLQELKLTDWDA